MPLRMTSEQPCPSCHGTGGRDGALPHTCPTCHGTGQTSRNAGGFAFAEPCRECRGRGLVVDDPCPDCARQRPGAGHPDPHRAHPGRREGRPADPAQGQGRARASAAARPATSTSPSRSRRTRLFGRSGDNLTLTVPVSFAEAALGGEVRVPTLGGSPVTLRIPPGTANGRTFRVRGKGVPRKRADGTPRGDLLVTVAGRRTDDAVGRGPVGGRGAARRHDRRRPAGRPARRAAEGSLRCRSPPAATAPGRATTPRRCSSSRWPPSSPGCTPRPCASTTGSGWSPRDARRAAAAATPGTTSPCCARWSGCPASASAWKVSGRCSSWRTTWPPCRPGSPSSRPSSTPFGSATDVPPSSCGAPSRPQPRR